MLNQTLKLQIITQDYFDQRNSLDLSGFLLNYNNKINIISVHHFLPIELVMDSSKQTLKIKENSCWSEILVIKPNKENIKEFKVIKNIQNKLPEIGNELVMYTNDIRYTLTVCGHELIPYDNINTNFKLPYICASFSETDESSNSEKKEYNNLAGLSGSPIFYKKKMVGVFSKYNVEQNTALIIPTYLIIKNLDKTDNNHIYRFPFEPKKINNYNVKDNYVYHPTLKYNIPVNTFLLLEGDQNNTFELLDNEQKVSIVKPVINSEFENNTNLIKRDNQFLITSRLLSLFKRIFDKKIMTYIILLINKSSKKLNKSELWIQYENNRFSIL